MSSLPDRAADLPRVDNSVLLAVIRTQVLENTGQQKKLADKMDAMTAAVEKLLALQTATTGSTPSGGT